MQLRMLLRINLLTVIWSTITLPKMNLTKHHRIKAIKELLLKALDNIDDHSAGSFAAFGSLSSAANPGLYVECLGPIGLPLTASDARRLVAIRHQAPFGRGSETIVDTSVRRTWELNPSQFLLRNLAWLKTIKKILIKSAMGLGI